VTLTITAFMPAHAQDSFPEFLIPNTSLTTEPQDIEDVEIELNSLLMRDVLFLQDQITLLESLIERQAKLQEFSRLNNNSEIKPIPQKICARLPANLPCLLHYPDDEKYNRFTVDIENLVREKQEERMLEMMASVNVDNTNQSNNLIPTLPSFLPQMSLPDRYGWKDIKCLKDECNALIASLDDPLEQYRLKEGDMIANEIRIDTIEPGAVKVFYQDKTLSLSPIALSNNNTAQSSNDNNPGVFDRSVARREIDALRPEFARQRRSEANAEIQRQSQAIPAQPDTTQPVTLGPTGLF
jgi:hypothetical protein